MSEVTEKLKSELAALSMDDRAELAHFLIRSLDEEVDEDDDAIEVAWSAEIERRMQEVTDGTAVGRPADQVMRELRAKYS